MGTKIAVGRYSLPVCNCGVPNSKRGMLSSETATGEVPCGEAPVAKWQWEDGVIYACKKHDKAISERRNKNWKTGYGII